MKSVGTSRRRGSGSSTTGSGRAHEALDFEALPLASPEAAAALERNRPGPMTLEEYARFLKQFPVTVEQLRAIPLFSGPRFTLD